MAWPHSLSQSPPNAALCSRHPSCPGPNFLPLSSEPWHRLPLCLEGSPPRSQRAPPLCLPSQDLTPRLPRPLPCPAPPPRFLPSGLRCGLLTCQVTTSSPPAVREHHRAGTFVFSGFFQCCPLSPPSVTFTVLDTEQVLINVWGSGSWDTGIRVHILAPCLLRPTCDKPAKGVAPAHGLGRDSAIHSHLSEL